MKRTLGVCYYPEHWSEDMWAEDAARMVETGLTWVRIGEFAWSRLEPVEGDLRFDWLDRAIAVLGEAGLKVILGTPTATPPRWMLDRHPDMLAVGEDGQTRKFGSRRHYCFSHEGYRTECARIVKLLAERYGSNSYVAAWQTDNEYGCHNTTLSYSPAAHIAFQGWLADRYGQIDTLNEAWGNVFWSMEYRTYDQIELPNQTVTEPNPAHVLDFARYSSDAVQSFNRLQTEIIRAYTDAPIMHNFMGRETGFDHFDVSRDLDIAAWDSYPLGFLEDRSDEGDAWKRHFQRQGDPDFQAFHHDLYRACGKGRWWVVEQQPGPVNWAPYNPAPLPGMARLWAWEAFAHGAEAVCYFRWRQAPFAQEQMHSGLLCPDSTPAPALAEAAQVAAEIEDFADVAVAKADVALVFDYQAAWAWAAQPQGRDFDYFRLVFETYRGLRSNGLAVDIIPPDCDDLNGYSMVVAPGTFYWRAAFAAALKQFEGLAVIGPRAGSKTENFSIPQSLPPDLPEAGLKVERVESLRPDSAEPLSEGGHFQIWREHVSGTAEVLECSVDGTPAVLQNGRIRYLAGWPDRAAMKRILRAAAAEAGLQIVDMPRDIRFRDAGVQRFVFNYGMETVDLSSIDGLSASGSIEPADVRFFALDEAP